MIRKKIKVHVCKHDLCVSQSDSGSAVLGPSLHSQKIARAKWEFLFGTTTDTVSSEHVKSE